MATRKARKMISRRGKRTARRHRSSIAGKIMPPLDVRSNKHLADFKKRITKGPLTIVLVYADWCGHCHTMMPHFDAASKSSNRSIQSVKVNEQMLPAVNDFVSKNINKSARPLNVEGYPSIILVNNKGEKVTDIEPVRDTATMTKLMNESGTLAKNANLNRSENSNTNANKLSNIGVEDEGLAASTPVNSDIGEDELKGSIEANAKSNKNLSLKAKAEVKEEAEGETKAANNIVNAGTKNNKNNQNNQNNQKEIIQNAIAPSPLNTFSGVVPKNITPPAKNVQKEADQITSLASPIEPPSMAGDIETPAVSNSLNLRGGGCGCGSYRPSGGSLFNAMARTTYSIAAPAALLATAAMVLKGKKTHKAKKAKKTIKQSRKTRSKHNRRR